MKGSYEAFASENKGIFRIGSVSCAEHAMICEKEKIESFPTLRLYPQFPAPTQDFDLSNDGFNVKKLKQAGGRYIGDKSIEITSGNHKTFVEEDVTIPKVLLFTEAKGTPFLYKALSANFEVSIS